MLATSYRIAAVPVLLAGVLACPACDSVLHECIEVGAGEAGLSVEERDQAVGIIELFVSEENLECKETEFAIIRNSYDTSSYDLTECWDADSYVTVQFAVSAHHVVVEFHKIGGVFEPDFMKHGRKHLTERFTAAFGSNRVLVPSDCYRDGHRITSKKGDLPLDPEEK